MTGPDKNSVYYRHARFFSNCFGTIFNVRARIDLYEKNKKRQIYFVENSRKQKKFDEIRSLFPDTVFVDIMGYT